MLTPNQIEQAVLFRTLKANHQGNELAAVVRMELINDLLSIQKSALLLANTKGRKGHWKTRNMNECLELRMNQHISEMNSLQLDY